MKKSKPKPVETLRYNSSIIGTEYLSQFAPASITLFYTDKSGTKNYIEFANAEAAFQYFKTTSPVYREKIKSCVLASKARYFGSKKAECPLRSDWEEIKDKVMLRVLWAKFSQNNVLMHKLIGTYPKKLIEHAPWDKEAYWGEVAEGEGKNKSGEILEKVRTRLSGKFTFSLDDPHYDMTKFY